jgi:hypothetical protein
MAAHILTDMSRVPQSSTPESPEQQDAIRELVRLLRTGYKAYLDSLKPQPGDNAKQVDSERVRDPAA